MIAATLKKYLKKVKEFSKENSAYEVASNLYIKGDKNNLLFSCSDANCGINQIVPIMGSPIIGECCVNIFNFIKMIDPLKDEYDLDITINNSNIIIKENRIKLQIQNYPSTSFFNIPEQKDPYVNLDKDFSNLFKKIIQVDNDDSYPIMFSHNYLYYANPRALVMTKTELFSHPFAIDNLFFKKALLDNFSQIKLTNSQLYLKNETCDIFLPLFNGNRIDLRGPLKAIDKRSIYTCKMSIDELNYYYKIIKNISDYMQFYRIDIIFNQDILKLKFLDSEFIIKDFFYDGPPLNYGIPILSFKQIVKESFIGNLKHLNIKLEQEPSMFIVEGDNVKFIGGLYRDKL